MKIRKSDRAIIKTISGLMLILMLCICSSGVRASAEGDGGDASAPVPTVSAQEVTPTPVPENGEEDTDTDEPELIAAYTPSPTPYPIGEAEVKLAFETAVYTGENITQKVESVKWGRELLVENKDYRVTEGLVRKEVGDYNVTIVGIGAYSGTVYAPWSIVAPTPTPEPTEEPTLTPDPEDPTPTGGYVSPTPTQGPVPPTPIPEPGFKVLGMEGKIYTGEKITQDNVLIKYDGLPLAKGRDYKIKYKNNTNAGTAVMVIEGKGNYSGKCEVEFTIQPVPLEEYCTAEDIVAAVRSTEKEKTAVVHWGDTQLKRLKDFDMSINPKELKDPGVYDIEITGKGNFTGSLNITATITEGVNVKNLKVSKIPDQQYDRGLAVTPLVTISYKNKPVTRGIDITYENNYETGRAYLVITGNGEVFNGDTYFAGRVKLPFKIVGRDISEARINVKDTVYTGRACKPEIKIKMGDSTLEEGIDYTVGFKYNRNVGTGIYIIHGKGKYSGKVTGGFEITQCSINSTDMDISLPERVYYEKDGPLPVPVIVHGTNVLRENVDYTVGYSENRQAGKIFKVYIEGIGNYKGRMSCDVMCYAKPMDMVISLTPDCVWKANKSIKQYIKAPVLMDTNGVMLEPGIDYEFDETYTDEFGDPLELTYKPTMGYSICIHVEGKGNYSGKRIIEYRAAASKISKVKFSVAKQTYTGYPVEPGQDQITTSIESGQYEIVYYKNNVKKGTATMIVHGLGQYGGYKKVKFKIAKFGMKE